MPRAKVVMTRIDRARAASARFSSRRSAMEKYGVEGIKAQQRMELEQVQRRLEALRLARYGRGHKEASGEIAELEARERALEEALGA
jgi:hypothetical protein